MNKDLPKFRKDKGLTQKDLAKQLGISRQALHALEHGISKPSIDLLARMEALFETPWRDFFPEISDKYPFGLSESRDFSSSHRRFRMTTKKVGQKVKTSKINDFSDQGEYYNLEIYLPNIKKDDIELEIGKNQLIVRIQQVEEQTKEEKQSYFHSVSSSSIQRTFNLNQSINQEKTDAKFENEILKIKLYKLKSNSEGKIFRL